MAVRVEKPVIVGILVVVACDLLLVRTLRVGLMMRVQETTPISHIFQSRTRSVRNFEWTVLAYLGTSQVSLEKRAHLSISGAAVLEDEEV